MRKVAMGEVSPILTKVRNAVAEKEGKLIAERTAIKGELSANRQELAKDVAVTPFAAVFMPIVAAAVTLVETVKERASTIIEEAGKIKDLKIDKRANGQELGNLAAGKKEVKKIGRKIEKAGARQDRLEEKQALISERIQAQKVLGIAGEQKLENVAKKYRIIES